MQYTVMCAVLGQNRHAFEVKVDNDEQVSRLTSEINGALGRSSAARLRLYYVNILVSEYQTLIKSVSERTIHFKKESELVNPFLGLLAIEAGFPNGHLHVLVELLEGESFSSRPGREVVYR